MANGGTVRRAPRYSAPEKGRDPVQVYVRDNALNTVIRVLKKRSWSEPRRGERRGVAQPPALHQILRAWRGRLQPGLMLQSALHKAPSRTERAAILPLLAR